MHNQLVPVPSAYLPSEGKGVVPSCSEASDRNRAQEETPPAYDMGALLAQEGKVSFQTSIDWFSATVNKNSAVHGNLKKEGSMDIQQVPCRVSGNHWSCLAMGLLIGQERCTTSFEGRPVRQRALRTSKN